MNTSNASRMRLTGVSAPIKPVQRWAWSSSRELCVGKVQQPLVVTLAYHALDDAGVKVQVVMHQGVAQTDDLVPGGAAVVMAEAVQLGEGLPCLAGHCLPQCLQALLGDADAGLGQQLQVTLGGPIEQRAQPARLRGGLREQLQLLGEGGQMLPHGVNVFAFHKRLARSIRRNGAGGIGGRSPTSSRFAVPLESAAGDRWPEARARCG